MTKLTLPAFNRPIIDEQGVLTQEMRVFFSDLMGRLPIYGEGSPEDVVSARKGATYYDMSEPAGSKMYIKVSDDISGDEKKGWEQQ